MVRPAEGRNNAFYAFLAVSITTGDMCVALQLQSYQQYKRETCTRYIYRYNSYSLQDSRNKIESSNVKLTNGFFIYFSKICDWNFTLQYLYRQITNYPKLNRTRIQFHFSINSEGTPILQCRENSDCISEKCCERTWKIQFFVYF